MKREYTILSNLHPVYPTAPKPYVFSDDESVVGSPFFIMERRKEVLLDTEFPEHLHYTKELGEKNWNLIVYKLVALHEVDYIKTDLIDLAKQPGIMERVLTV